MLGTTNTPQPLSVQQAKSARRYRGVLIPRGAVQVGYVALRIKVPRMNRGIARSSGAI
jgi:hypothetical protein